MMSLREYIERQYPIACGLQRRITRDAVMIEMLRSGSPDAASVKLWMQEYKLFQGITSQDRDAIANRFTVFAQESPRINGRLDNAEIRRLYTELFSALYGSVERSWMSATSKLLWCMYPSDIVMYDAFVHRVLLVLQNIDADLAGGSPRINAPQQIGSNGNIEPAIVHYMTYQSMVRRLMAVHGGLLQELRERHVEEYPYDIRILDKLLWMIGNPGESL